MRMDLRERAIETVAVIDGARTEKEILSALSDFAANFGFEKVYISQFLNPGRPLPKKWLSANDWPEELLEVRRRNGAIVHDPVVRMGLYAHQPFHWDEARATSNIKGLEIMGQVGEFNLKSGMVFPIRCYGLPPGIISMGGEQIEMSRWEQHLTELAAREAYLKLVDLEGSSTDASPKRLSKREAEVLTLVAEGDGNGSVAERLGITQETVKDTLKRCYRKLGVTNRASAVTQALLTSQIFPLPRQ